MKRQARRFEDIALGRRREKRSETNASDRYFLPSISLFYLISKFFEIWKEEPRIAAQTVFEVRK